MAPPFTVEIGPIDDKTKAIAEKELRETPEIVKQARNELRALLENDRTIQFVAGDDYLDIFLRPCKFYASSAYQLIKRFTDFKERNKHLLGDLMPDDEKEAFTKYQVVNVLKNRDHKGRRVLIVNCGGIWDPSKVTTDQIFRIFYMIHIISLLELETQVCGAVVLMDCDGLGMKQIMALNPMASLRLLTFVQDAMPARIKEVHIIRQPIFFNIAWNIFKPFVREKLKNRLFFHDKKMESLHKYIARSHLPKNYDGDLPEIDYSGADWYPSVQKHLDHIRKMNSCRVIKR